SRGGSGEGARSVAMPRRDATVVPAADARFRFDLGPPHSRNAQDAWRSAAGDVQLLLRCGLDSRVVLEELLVQLDEVLPLLRSFVLGEDRLHRAHRLAGAAVDALVGVDVEHRLTLVDAVDRADLYARLVLPIDVWLIDFILLLGIPLVVSRLGWPILMIL